MLEMISCFPYQFNPAACATCGGRCCRGAGGYVWVSWEELEAMAAARGMNPGVFAAISATAPVNPSKLL
ncbi:hypothetical protein VU06_03705 [Desulfobulbus sp. F3]|nr:hypothetical protein [Desulfobulbus sp. F3]